MYRVNNNSPRILRWGSPETTDSNPENCWDIASFCNSCSCGCNSSFINDELIVYSCILVHVANILLAKMT